MLCASLLQYTKDDAKVKARGTEGAFEALRCVVSKGKNANVTQQKRQGPRKALNPEQAKHTNKVETNEGKVSLRLLNS